MNANTIKAVISNKAQRREISPELIYADTSERQNHTTEFQEIYFGIDDFKNGLSENSSLSFRNDDHFSAQQITTKHNNHIENVDVFQEISNASTFVHIRQHLPRKTSKKHNNSQQITTHVHFHVDSVHISVHMQHTKHTTTTMKGMIK